MSKRLSNGVTVRRKNSNCTPDISVFECSHDLFLRAAGVSPGVRCRVGCRAVEPHVASNSISTKDSSTPGRMVRYLS